MRPGLSPPCPRCPAASGQERSKHPSPRGAGASRTDLLLQLSPLASSVQRLRSFWGQESLGPAGWERPAVGSGLWPGPLALLPAAFRLSGLKGSRAPTEGDCLRWLSAGRLAARLQLVVLAGPMLPEGPPVASLGSSPSTAFVPRLAGGQPGMDHLLLSGEGAQDACLCLCRSPRPRPRTLPLRLPFCESSSVAVPFWGYSQH